MPTVLCCSGLDPTGGAGLHADIQSITAASAHPCVLATALTVQSTTNVRTVNPVPVDILEQQAAILCADCEVQSIKIGLIGSAQQLPWLKALLQELGRPTVVDPVLRAGGGTELVGASFEAHLKELIFPHVQVLTPNAAEARRLADCEDLATAGARLLEMGVEHVLITGGDEEGEAVENHWFHRGQAVRVFRWQRLQARYHGAGCTLAAAIAAHLALGRPVEAALQRAQEYTFKALQQAIAVGRGRLVPLRQMEH